MKQRTIQNILSLWVGTIITSTAGFLSAHAQTLAQALDATNLVWSTGGDAPWLVETTNTYDGIAAAQSGFIQSNQTSWLQTTVVGPATLSFWSDYQPGLSGQNGFSWNFSVNNPGQSPYNGVGLIPFGYQSWQQSTYDLGAGTNVLRWTGYAFGATTPASFVDVDQVVISPPRPVTIEYQPADSTVYAGSPVYLSVYAIGTPPLQYQWYVNGTNITGATNSWFQLAQSTTNDTGIYSVMVTNDTEGFVFSSNATVTVLPPSPPFFTQEPADAVEYSGQSFYWYPTVDGTPPFTFQWRKNGAIISSATNQYLEFTNLSLTDAGIYILAVTNSLGGIESTGATLTVIQSVMPAITNQPRSLDVVAGVNTWMTVGATGIPTPFFNWIDESVPPPPPSQFPIRFLNSNPKLYLNNVAPSNSGVYFVTASNSAGQAASQEVLLTVLPPITNLATCSQDALGIFVTNGLVFLTRGTNGLAILSVTNPASPTLLGTIPAVSYTTTATVSGGLLYLADDTAGLQIFSVTNPASPVLLGSYPISAGVGQMVVRSNLVYVADGFAGLVILDASIPTKPALVGSYASDFIANSVCLSGHYAIVSSPNTVTITPGPGTYVAGLFIIDISNPAHPSEVGQLSTGVGRMGLQGPNIFGVTPTGGSLDIFTVTNPAVPLMIGAFSHYTGGGSLFGPAGYDVRVANGLAFLAGNYGGKSMLYVVDVKDPTQPIPVGFYTDAGQPTAMAVDNGRVYLAGAGSPLEILQTPFNTGPVAAPLLSASRQTGYNLGIQGRHGFHYDVQYSSQIAGGQWQTLQTILLTNDTAVITAPSGPGTRFFRLRQDD